MLLSIRNCGVDWKNAGTSTSKGEGVDMVTGDVDEVMGREDLIQGVEALLEGNCSYTNSDAGGARKCQ